MASISILEQLSNACVEAARCSLEVLNALKEQQLIANFGFFDLDAAFSAAFVFVLVDRIHANTSQLPSKTTICKASGILEHLSSQGNIAAGKRRADIDQMCAHLGISFHDNSQDKDNGARLDKVGPHGPAGEADGAHSRGQEPDEHPSSAAAALTQNENLARAECTRSQNEASASHFDWAQAAATLFDHSLADAQEQQQSMAAALSFGEGGNEIFNSLYLEDFSLTGVVETDWAEFSKQLASQNEPG
ncbi:hypothetical protein CCHL11_10120 [Colletotrichum chlorophyti]|uniref:Uncharacterized protein n=1 Tax=Colletotrichum chlorophyti TaxID=708187 RepID=A0A1Q8RX55_9PEZI|nr:hypothetical protein CCHL11_10120 [Colletotrichum chlorophyti]